MEIAVVTVYTKVKKEDAALWIRRILKENGQSPEKIADLEKTFLDEKAITYATRGPVDEMAYTTYELGPDDAFQDLVPPKARVREPAPVEA